MAAGLAAADAIIAPTRAMLAEIECGHPLPAGTTQVIPNGAAPLPPRTAQEPPSTELHQISRLEGRKFDAVRSDGPFVLGAGRFWDAAKNLAALDGAAAGLKWPVVLAGDLGDGLEAQHARAVGRLGAAELASLRRQASIYAAPAVYEPFGLGILEAAHDRCALVLGDIPSLRELWDEAAIFVDPRDPQALREGLTCLIDGPRLREDLGARAQRRAADYSIDRAANAYRRLYRQLVDRKRPSSRIAEGTAFSGAAR
jgi:glycogen synthase